MLNPETRIHIGRLEAGWLLACLLTQTLLIVHASVVHPPMVDEGGHLLSGLFYLRAGQTDFYPHNPPLAKAVCAAPLLAHPDFVWPEFKRPPLAHSVIGAWTDQFQQANGEQLQALTILGRLPLLAFSLGTTLVIWAWGRALWGPAGAAVAVALWATDPLNLAWSSCLTTDAAAALAFTLTLWLAWRDRGGPTWRGTLGWATALAAALLCKFSLLILVPLLVVLLGLNSRWRTWRGFAAVLLAGVWALLLINLAYGFDGSGEKLGGIVFRSHFLAGRTDGLPGNRFAGTWFGEWPALLPRDYWQGLDLQKSHADFGFRNYLCGEWKRGGWPHYYLVCLAVKMPLGTWFLAGVALILALGSARFRQDWRNELWLALPTLALFAAISSQTGINGYFRYLLPMLPFLFLSLGRVGRCLEAIQRGPRRQRWLAGFAVAIPLAWNLASVAGKHPHHLAYFNETAGGPEQGARWLLESNLDWGQDLYRLRDWLAEHPEARPIFVGCQSGAALPHLGIEAPPPALPATSLAPGWYALGISYVHGKDGWLAGAHGRPTYFQPGSFSHFQRLTPAARVGHSILIYRVP